MSLTSLSFFLFLLVTVILYYVSGKHLQKYVLLAAGLYFYFQVITIETSKVLLVLGYIILVTYLGALFVERCKGKVKTIMATVVISALVAALFVLKYAYNMANLFMDMLRMNGDVEWLQFASLMGMSYFVLSAIGYIMDVFWESYKPEKNIFVVALFILYFPQLVSGPITRFADMKEQFCLPHRPECQKMEYGLRRMAWGYFKKLVISERFAIVATTLFEHYDNCNGIQIIGAALCYVVRLYTDFSGCMDIIMGASGLFGITLPENFKAPFLSKTVKEFWQRWHITLGNWFKDYVMYSVQISKPFVTLGKKCKKRFGKKVGKKIPTYVSMFILWFLLGVWHGGTARYFMASALIPFVLLIGGDLLEPFFARLAQKSKVNVNGLGFVLFQRIRTTLLLCLCWIFVCTPTLQDGFQALKRLVFHLASRDVFQLSPEVLGFEYTDIFLMLVGIMTLVAEHMCLAKETTISEVLDRQKAVIKYGVIYAEILMILFFGMVGASTFIYFKF